jgi:type IV pilus assembly protein PilB
MPKASSIEDLMKAAASAAPAAAPAPVGSAAPPKPAKKPAAPSQGEKMGAKMSEIRLQELEQLAAEKAATLGLPFVSLKEFPIPPEALSIIPRADAERLKTLCFFANADEIRLATTNPSPDVDALLKNLTEERRANGGLYFISEESFRLAFRLYDVLPTPKEVIFGYRIEEADLKKFEKEIANLNELQDKIKKVTTTDIVTLIIGASLKNNASDIHIEAEEDDVKVRFRLDGILQDAASLPKDTWKAIISRLKLLAGVKINVDDVPQDGRITIYLTSEKIDIRVSFLPTAFGESVVMRLLRPKAIALEFDNLGIRGLALERLNREIEKPNGMIITTGPTGSGKTTTLYAILKKLNTSEVKIITLEDPIEYKLKGINQSQIDHSKGYDFAKGLRSILRQDPEIVMVGEIRDLETADIAIQAALTGHLMISTIHTNSAAGAIPRFLSMGVKPFLLAPAHEALPDDGIERRLCPDCKVPAELTPSTTKQVTLMLETIPESSGYKVDPSAAKFFGPGKGCATCNGRAYKGRVGIYEIFTMNKEIEKVILSKEVSEYTIGELARKDGMITMGQDGLLKALDGLTSVEEVLSVANFDASLLEPEEEVPNGGIPPASATT